MPANGHLTAAPDGDEVDGIRIYCPVCHTANHFVCPFGGCARWLTGWGGPSFWIENIFLGPAIFCHIYCGPKSFRPGANWKINVREWIEWRSPWTGKRGGGGFVRFARRRHQNQQKQTKINVKVEFKAFLSESIQAGTRCWGMFCRGGSRNGLHYYTAYHLVGAKSQEDHVSHTFVLLFK